MCLYSRLIENPKFKANKKNGGNIPPIKDPRTVWVPIGCGECMECRKQKAREWNVRLLEDIKENKNGKFITLTFSDKSIGELSEDVRNWKLVEGKRVKQEVNLQGYALDNAICTRAVRLFVERWRKVHKKTLRHWLVTEIGHEGTKNVHIHGIIWTNESLNKVEEVWNYGWMWKGKMIRGQLVNYVNGETVSYIVKYIHKVDEENKTFKSKILTSPGIGANYTRGYDISTNHYRGENTREYYRTPTGHKVSLPIYYRNKVYTDEQKEQLWIDKLNKEERWVCGERVSVKDGMKEYENLRQFYRRRNAELGYGTGWHSKDRQNYEGQIRKIMQDTRIEKGKGKRHNTE